jgi:hypothetical protein
VALEAAAMEKYLADQLVIMGLLIQEVAAVLVTALRQVEVQAVQAS